MRDDHGILAQRWRLQVALRLMRQEAGLTAEQVAEAMDWSLSKIVRIESGTVRMTTHDLKALLHLYEIGDPRRTDELLAIAKEARLRVTDNSYRGFPLERQLWKDLSGDDFEHAIEAQLAPANLILSPTATTARAKTVDNHFDTNESFWERVLNEEIRANATVALKNFLLFEWFPRSPGLFHTKRGKIAREDAADHRILGPPKAPHGSPDPIVYDLYGKVRMLEGGLGCIRLLPKRTEHGTLWFMSASSTRSAHEGVPIAMADSLYNKCIDYIAQYGALPCNIVGKLRFLPKPILSLYGDYVDVPGFYLLVEEVKPARSYKRSMEGPPVVSVAVTFEAVGSRASAAYVSFVPGDRYSIDSALDWLDHYVSSHGGTIVTDFDEQLRRFNGALFSLDKVCNGQLDGSEIKLFTGKSWHYIDRSVIENLLMNQDRLNSYRIHIGEVNVMGDIFNNIGPGAVVVNRSTLNNAMNVVGAMADAETADALQQIATLIEQSGSSDAMENFNAFSNELQQPQPKKSLLKSLWNGIVAALPSVVTLTDATAKIATLFH